MTIRYNNHPVVGFGASEEPAPSTAKTPSPWPMVLASSVVSAVVGWSVEEVARKFRRKKR